MTSNKITKATSVNIDEQDKIDASVKTCFIIMPIADISGYDTGHFSRVYEHIIKPSCEIAGFKPIRSDEINSSHMIVIDILKKIVDSDLAICDLSGRNPNVLYELGLRQAFNKKTVLIKDIKTDNIFDVQGFRYTPYDSTLRIDNVKNEIQKLALAITETYEAQGDVNSIVQLLQIEPARIDSKTQLTESDTVIFQAVSDLKKTVEKLANNNINQMRKNVLFSGPYNEDKTQVVHIDNKTFKLGTYYQEEGSINKDVGKLIKIDMSLGQLIFLNGDSQYGIDFSNSIVSKLSARPF